MDRTQMLKLVARARKINVWVSHAQIYLRVGKAEFIRGLERRDRSERDGEYFYNPTKVSIDAAGYLWIS